MLYSMNRLEGATKQLVAVGKLKGKRKDNTARSISNEDYRMISPFFNVSKNKK